ncbi:MAG: hypothetical protein HKN33_03300 [Pyrinomonadaceae bacterium]|nr:hypothetical protein [Pyrinomonadaceae bacterium]
MDLSINPTKAESLADLKREHLSSIVAPLDAYWEEAVIGFSEHLEIRFHGERAGFVCINGENQIVCFYLCRRFRRFGADVLRAVIAEKGIVQALVGTNDPFFLSQCLDRSKNTEVHTLLFGDNEDVGSDDTVFGEITFEPATAEDFEEVFENYCGAGDAMDAESVETGFEDLKGYIRTVMNNHRIFVLRENGRLIATSECRISKTQEPFADVGMIVAGDQRRRGVGGHVLKLTKAFCYERDLEPICSCEAGNIGSMKAIMNAGFVSSHRILLADIT